MPEELETAIACRPTGSLGEFLSFETWPEVGAYYDQNPDALAEMRIAVQAWSIFRKQRDGEPPRRLSLSDAELIAWMEHE